MVTYWLQYKYRDKKNRAENQEISSFKVSNFDKDAKVIQDAKEHYPEKMVLRQLNGPYAKIK